MSSAAFRNLLSGSEVLRDRGMAMESLVSCAWLKQQLEAGRKDIRVLDGMAWAR